MAKAIAITAVSVRVGYSTQAVRPEGALRGNRAAGGWLKGNIGTLSESLYRNELGWALRSHFREADLANDIEIHDQLSD